MSAIPLYWWADFYGHWVVYRDATGVHVHTREMAR